MQVSPETVAVLVDRVDTLVNDSKAMRSQLEDIRVSFAKLESMPREIADLKAKNESQARTIEQHKLIFKLMGAVLLACVGLIGWGWREGKSLYATDVAADRRLLLLEYKLGIPQPVPEGEK